MADYVTDRRLSSVQQYNTVGKPNILPGSGAPSFQSPAFLTYMWGRVKDGGVSPQEGADMQREIYVRNQQALEQNNYLPPGVTREGLIARARQGAPYQYSGVNLGDAYQQPQNTQYVDPAMQTVVGQSAYAEDPRAQRGIIGNILNRNIVNR